jgi:predicted ATP-grasp superfamily ATP-dependent carboligase
VVKPRVGSGGRGVVVAATLDELHAAITAQGDDEYFYEKFIDGHALSYGALAIGGETVVTVVYDVVARLSALYPAAFVASVDAPQMDAIGADIVRATGMDGLLNLNMIRDESGTHWVHDVNPRAWGSVIVAAALGADVCAAYIAWLAGNDVPAGHSRPGHARIPVFPSALAARDEPSASPRAYLRWLWGQRRICGSAYVLVEIARNRRALLSRNRPAPLVHNDGPRAHQGTRT